MILDAQLNEKSCNQDKYYQLQNNKKLFNIWSCFFVLKFDDIITYGIWILYLVSDKSMHN